MPISNMKDSRLEAGGDWIVSCKKNLEYNSVRSVFSMLERSGFVDLGLSHIVSGKVVWEGDHVRIILNAKDSKGLRSM